MENCIYRIINTTNNKVYIGSTIDSDRRKQEHLSQLDNNVHINTHLQNSYNKYGKDVFVFDVIEHSLDNNELTSREQHYIDLFNSSNINFGYNISSYADRPDGRRYTKTYTINLREVLTQNQLLPSSIALMVYLQINLENHTNRIVIGKGKRMTNEYLEKCMNMSRQTLSSALNELENANIVKRVGISNSRQLYFNPNISTSGVEVQKETYDMFNMKGDDSY